MFKGLFRRNPQPVQEAGVDASAGLPTAERCITEGNRLEDAGRVQEACDLYRAAVAAAPRHPAAHLNLGIGLVALGDAVGAKDAYEALLALDPDHAMGNYNFACLAHASQNLPLAEQLVRRALRAKPDFADGHVVLANVLEEQGRGEAALNALDAALLLRPDFLGARANRALLLGRLMRDDEAIDEARRVLATERQHLPMLDLASSLLVRQKVPEEALPPIRAALLLAPQHLDYHSRQLFLLNFDETLSPAEVFARHQEFGARMEAAHPARFPFEQRLPRAERRLRIGYVSSDLYAHPVTVFLLPVLERHDRQRFEVFCYFTGSRSDATMRRIQALCDGWRDAVAMSDEALADAICADDIDVLVDLAGHSGTQRMAVFSQRPAPVQVSWLGYLQTTGLTRMDYRLSDPRSSPAETSAQFHTEKLVALSPSQWCYRPVLEVATAEAAPFLKNGFITFGSFAQVAKISAAMCRRWAGILAQLPDARLVIAGLSSVRKRSIIEEAFRETGTEMARIELLPRMDLDAYFAAFNRIDIALDTYPYGGGTTTLDSLWMSVPVVTALGPAPMSRSAASLLLELGMEDWVAPRIEEYEQTVVQRARDAQTLAALRISLRQRLQASALMDEAGFTARLEAAYDGMWATRGL